MVAISEVFALERVHDMRLRMAAKQGILDTMILVVRFLNKETIDFESDLLVTVITCEDLSDDSVNLNNFNL